MMFPQEVVYQECVIENGKITGRIIEYATGVQLSGLFQINPGTF